MTIDNITTDLEISKRLKKNGFPQETVFYYLGEMFIPENEIEDTFEYDLAGKIV